LSFLEEAGQEVAGSHFAVNLDDGIERIEPLLGFGGIGIRQLVDGAVEEHGVILAELPTGTPTEFTSSNMSERCIERIARVVEASISAHVSTMCEHDALMNLPVRQFASTVVVYTDGACSGNPGPGGWAWAVAPDGEERGFGGEARTTNQRMELTAAIEAVRINGPIARGETKRLVIVSDSTYVVHCFRDRWWVKWKANGWRNSKREPVANSDLWDQLIELYLAFPEDERPDFQWVKGHSGDPMNDLVDRLAVEAIP
jgi:ribonuclease HI